MLGNIYIYIYVTGPGAPPLLPPLWVWVGWFGVGYATSVMQASCIFHQREQIEISDSGLRTFSFWLICWSWQIIIQISKCLINILTWDIVQSKYSFSKSTIGAKSPLFRADLEENGSGASNPCWNHGFEWWRKVFVIFLQSCIDSLGRRHNGKPAKI